jgi:hypothetical protein
MENFPMSIKCNELTRIITTNDGDKFRAAVRGASHIQVPMAVFESVPDNRRQRDTLEHAKKWQREIRSGVRQPGYIPPHSDVVIAVWPTGIMKCDGHTRMYMWRNGLLDHPPQGIVNILIKYVANEQEALDLYTFYDNKAAAETSADVSAGAQRLTGIILTKPFFSKGGNTQALRNSYAMMIGGFDKSRPNRSPIGREKIPDERGLKELFLPVLAHLDRIDPFDSTLWQAQILTTAIATTVVDGRAAIGSFFGPYSDERQHIQHEGMRNAVGHLANLRRDPKTFHHYSSSAEFDNVQRVIRLYDEHMYRIRNGFGTTFEMSGARGDFKKPRYAGSHKRVDLQRFDIGDDEIRRRIGRLHASL